MREEGRDSLTALEEPRLVPVLYVFDCWYVYLFGWCVNMLGPPSSFYGVLSLPGA